MVLTEKQKQELHSAILDYLTSGGFSTAAEAFKTGLFFFKKIHLFLI